MILVKLHALYCTLVALVAKFPNTQTDLGVLWVAIETAVVTRVWTLSVVEQIVTDAQGLAADFAAEWDGSQTEWDAFCVRLKALFSC